MIRTFESISPHLRLKPKAISIDNIAFKFHYRATFLILLVCTILVTSRQYIGEHIRCMTGGTIPEHVINTFCFFTTTFTVVRHLNETMLELGHIPHPGVGPMLPEDEVQHHAYYQWVPFVLFAQALMFYFPHFLWRIYEGGKIKTLVHGLQMVGLSRYMKKQDDVQINANYRLFSRTTVDGRMKTIKIELKKHFLVNQWWAARFFFCELLNIANLVLQIYFVNRFLGGQFLKLGILFIHDDFQGPMDPLDIVFPKVTKCLFYKYGASGSIQKHDALCVMALNVINEKIYIFLWFWFIVLAIITTLALLWRILTFCLHSRSARFNGIVFSLACPGRLNPGVIPAIQELRYTEWLFLYYLVKNLDSFLARGMLEDLEREMRSRISDEEDSDGNSSDSNEDIDKPDKANVKLMDPEKLA